MNPIRRIRDSLILLLAIALALAGLVQFGKLSGSW